MLSSSSNMLGGTSSALLVDDGVDDETESMIPDERDWHMSVAQLKKKIGDFNINNYASIALTDNEHRLYTKIMAKIPESKQVYI